MSHHMQDGQAAEARDSNVAFFLKNLDAYRSQVATFETYRNIHERLSREVMGVDRLLDIGNGGVFAYDTGPIREIIALDLFFDRIPPAVAETVFPANVIPRAGSALSIPEPDGSFDAVIMVMLIHHLVGDTVKSSVKNMETALREAWRVLKPGGRVIIVESCIPAWFYAFERVVFRPAAAIIKTLLDHPHTLQYPVRVLKSKMRDLGADVSVELVPIGRWVIQYGFKWPSALTPARAYIFTATKSLR